MLKGFGARFKKARADNNEQPEPKPMDFGESYRIRGKMIGVLLRDAREKAGRGLDDCARLLRTTPDVIEAWEFGDASPSLPQLELLAYYLDVPVSHFWGMDTLQADADEKTSAQEEYIALRTRMIGALLRLAREERGMTLEQMADESGLPVDRINAYELGEMPLPMHELTVLSNCVRKNIPFFLESQSHLGEWLALREEWQHFTKLPDDIRKFAANPINLGFIEIAIMFSTMPADKLRKVGESVLNISM
ncbi:MAG: helix-turn-helix transcriptional regulator [Anaerolineae bacterium]|uniref:helix-turn-helix domain-containing protein n=1 Tax=Candidatus Flexifilum breve TaxID=3140694 RepID=UPI001AC12B26|nr:helix-turn-helix transcriptional regulator [Chloroflexota bacterium]MBK9750566.1 helix-turn-helix transcriptional regulator [Chloroflexota bacterium]MBN8636283.1 helix-turn-helix transcriptional regulator [Anaerolineae bacterium]